ncbi:MAG: peptide deformylase, partial [Erysipelotrichaceae bacterium]|nr:peptide deformylase [Erysipelotrichaceae bacterium]
QKTYLQDGESCLSVAQDHEGYIYRAHHITIVGYDLLTSTEVKLELNGYPAIVFQHEYDHLNGVLFYDRINKNDPFKKLPNAIAISFDTDSETETGK